MKTLLGRRPLGVRVALGAFAFYLFLGMGGQLVSLLDWELALSLGLQENAWSDPSLVERTLAAVEWGVCGADMLVQVPLLIVAIVGILCRRRWGLIAGLMVSATMVYIFFVYTLQRTALIERAGLAAWSDYAGIIIAFAFLALVPGILGFWGLAANLDRYPGGSANSHRLRRRADTLPGSRIEDLLICAGQVLRTIPRVWIGRQMTWNTTDQDLNRRLMADAWIEGGFRLDRAIRIERPPEAVWPWIAQLGRDAAYYSWDFLDNPGHAHPDYLLDDVPPPQVGDRNDDLGSIRFLNPGAELAWFDESEFLGLKVPLAMTFRLDAAGEGATRLLFRMSFDIPKTIKGWLAFRLVVLMDHVMSSEMLSRLRLLIETYEERLAGGETNRDLAPHQRTEWLPAAATRKSPNES